MKIEKIHKYLLENPNVFIDSRDKGIVKGKSLFFALQGAVDGNHYAQSALENGCSYAVVDNPLVVKGDRYLLVDDVLEVLQRLAKFHREYCGVKILALTGSSGKTTTKELIKRVLAKKYKVLATEGNLNNHIGVPLTLLRLTPNVDIGIIEMGASAVGEIDFLCHIALPNMGLITNIGDAHSGGFGSVENIKKAKSELFDYIANNGELLFVNTNNKAVSEIAEDYEVSMYSYGLEKSQVTGAVIQSTPFLKCEIDNSIEVSTHLFGNYNLENILAAYAVGKKYGVMMSDIVEAISSYEPKNGRSQQIRTKYNLVIMDAYNANPSSMSKVLQNFFEMHEEEKSLCILGDMKELANPIEEHKKIKDLLLENGFENKAYLVGSVFCELEDKKFDYFQNVEELKGKLKDEPLEGVQILVKGSHSVGLEEIEDLL